MVNDKRYDDASEYIIAESPELSLGENEGWTKKIIHAFPAFKHRNYKLYFFGQAISLIGTWMQTVALGWLVFQLTHSAYLVGLITALGTVPVLLFALIGGVIVDRFPKKPLLLFTQAGALLISLLLGILTVSGYITVWQIGMLAFLNGTLDALDKPARQSFVVEMVGKEGLTSAIALNSGLFNGARVVGPAIAGMLIAMYGSGGAFLINAVSFIAVLIALMLIKTSYTQPAAHPNPIRSMAEGIRYAYNHETIRSILFFAAISSIFGWSYTTLMPVIVQTVYHQDASGLGYFYAAGGIGALAATFLVSAYAKRFSPLFFILGGNFLFAISLYLFSLSPSLLLSLVILFFAGLGLLSQFAMMNTLVQHIVPNEIRGRIMSLYTLMFIGMAPLGNYEIGLIAHHVGPMVAIQLNVMVLFAFGLYFYAIRKKLSPTFV